MKVVILILSIFLIVQVQDANGQHLKSNQAIEDIKEFNHIIKNQSSYFQISDLDIDSLTTSAIKTIEEKDSVALHELTSIISSIFSKINDSHGSIRSEIDEEFEEQYDTIRFPIPLAPLNDAIIALTKTRNRGVYKLYTPDYPFVKEINNLKINDFMEFFAYENNMHPKEARIARSIKDIRNIGELYFMNFQSIPDKIRLLLSNGKQDTLVVLDPKKKNNTWRYLGDLGELPIRDTMKQGIPFKYENLVIKYDDQVDYIMIPKMISYLDYPSFELFLETYFNQVKKSNSKGLIVDIRGNSGGSRDIIKTFGKYLVNTDQSPWVANVAYVRNDQFLDEDMSSMQSRYLYNYRSTNFSQEQRDAIDTFNLNFRPKFDFNRNKFSTPFYMVLNFSEDHYLKKPTYILCDENSFSAASILASVFKGLENVKICGTTTDGSSGRSRYFFLTNSNIRIKLSTMLSFQRNGFPLDGHGTVPDISIPRNMEQVLGHSDYQLMELIRIVKTRHNSR